jgi:hypothetical protein
MLRLYQVLPLVGGLAALVFMLLVAGQFEWLLEIWWFGELFPPTVGKHATTWLALLIVSAGVCAVVHGVSRVVNMGPVPIVIMAWLRKYTSFVALLSFLVAIQLIAVVESAGPRGPDTRPELIALTVCALAAITWPLVYGGRRLVSSALVIFMLGAVILAVALVLLEPYAFHYLASVVNHLLGLEVVEVDQLFMSGRFLPLLPWLAPVAPILWATWVGYRDGCDGLDPAPR